MQTENELLGTHLQGFHVRLAEASLAKFICQLNNSYIDHHIKTTVNAKEDWTPDSRTPLTKDFALVIEYRNAQETFGVLVQLQKARRESLEEIAGQRNCHLCVQST